MSAAEKGLQAPDFTLTSTTGERITLSSFRGRQHVVVAFFMTDWSTL